MFTLKAGGHIDSKNNEGQSLAMIAAVEGHNECLALLIASGVDLSVQDGVKNTALSLAEDTRNMAAVKMIKAVLEKSLLNEALGLKNESKLNALRL